MEPWRGFQEGNAYQYTYFVPHQPEALVKKMGQQTFNHRLDSTFTLAEKALFGGGANIDAFAGIAGIYNHGNQPNLHVSWLFNHSGRPSLTQKWVRSICDKFYGTEGIHGYGFGQDEDQGQLGAWFVMAGIGLFDVKGFTETDAQLGLGSPLFSKVRIQLNQKYYPGKEFTIIAANNGGKNNYIQSIRLNGQTLHSPFVPWSSIKKGGTLNLQMGTKTIDQY
jgi:putative alpha-1,2-mannosidase